VSINFVQTFRGYILRILTHININKILNFNFVQTFRGYILRILTHININKILN